MCAYLTYGEVARGSQTVKVEGTKIHTQKRYRAWMEVEAEGGVRCSLFLLWVAEEREEKFESWGRNQKCQQIESEQSWDRLEGESINSD